MANNRCSTLWLTEWEPTFEPPCGIPRTGICAQHLNCDVIDISSTTLLLHYCTPTIKPNFLCLLVTTNELCKYRKKK